MALGSRSFKGRWFFSLGAPLLGPLNRVLVSTGGGGVEVPSRHHPSPLAQPPDQPVSSPRFAAPLCWTDVPCWRCRALCRL